MSYVDAVAVESVVEARAACPDVDKAQAALADALLSSRAPRRGSAGRWTVTVRVSRLPSSGRSAEATIVDDKGALVSERTLADRDGKGCAPLVRAVGAWATLVIDAELDRAHDPSPADVAARDASITTTTTTTTSASAREPGSARSAADAEEADRNGMLEPRTGTEVGGAMYLRSGLRSASLAGFSPYASFEIARSWRLRPSIAFGLGTSDRESHVAAAVEACRRIPGNYTDRRGLSADLCAALRGGTIFGDSTSSSTPYVGLAPVLALRGDIGAGLSGEVRGSVGADWASHLFWTSEAQIGISGVLP